MFLWHDNLSHVGIILMGDEYDTNTCKSCIFIFENIIIYIYIYIYNHSPAPQLSTAVVVVVSLVCGKINGCGTILTCLCDFSV